MNFLGFVYPYSIVQSNIFYMDNFYFFTYVNEASIDKLPLMVCIIFQRIQSNAIVII